MNIFVGNLPFAAADADVKKLFEDFGSVASVRIVMEKKGKKSRGFGFVEMTDEQQAQSAISALNGKEFMGRPLNVSPARPKPEVERDKGEAKKIRHETKVKRQEHPKEEGDRKRWYNPVFNKKRGRYKTGRRSQSFMKRRAALGITNEAVPKQESRENPLRWRKKNEQPEPWKKIREEHRPWKKVEGEFKPWGKRAGELKPFKKKEGEFKPWGKRSGEAKPWRKSKKRPRPRQSQIESRRKPGGYVR